MSQDLRYPIGRFEPVEDRTAASRERWVAEIEEAPAALRDVVAGLDDEQLDTPYRDGGWSVRQVVHHVPDSHMNGYVRFRLALTEDEPTIRPYEEAAWARLTDARTLEPEVSLDLLDALHGRWVPLLRSLDLADWQRTLVHPLDGVLTLDTLLQLYAWHGRHHVAHIRALRDARGW